MLLSYAWFSVGMAVTALMTRRPASADAVRHRSRCRRPGRHHGRDRLGVRPTGRRTSATPSCTAAVPFEACWPRCSPSSCLRDRLAGHVLDRGAADRHPASTGVLQDARVAELVARPRSRRRGRALSEKTGVPLEEAAALAAPAGGQPERTGFAGLFSGGNALPDPAGARERHRTRAGLRAQHLAARADEARRILDQGLARVPAGAQRRRRDRRVDRLPDRRPVRAQAGGRGGPS